LSVSPFAVTGEPDVGDVLVAFGPSVDLPLESVMPDCDWFRVDDESLLIAPPPIFELSLLMLEPPIAPALSDAGATAPPAVAVSVVLSVFPLLHAATATRAAAIIAMRFM